MNSEAPINSGHAFANAAEEYEEQELWLQAAQSHENAANQFQLALQYTEDNEAAKTIRLLVANHTRRAREIQRKWQKLKVEQRSTSATLGSHTHNDPMMDHVRQMNMQGLLAALPPNQESMALSVKRGESSQHGTIGESYALLSPQEEEDDASDPFNRFLKVVETLMDQLSNPVAFASAPLHEDDMPTPYQQRMLAGDPPPTEDTNIMSESFFIVPDHPETTTPTVSARLSNHEDPDLKTENTQLKHQVEQLTRRLRSLEKTAEESHMLKSSILQFRNDVHRQAKRIMQSHDPASLRASSAALTNSAIQSTIHSQPRPSVTNGTTTAELVTRMKDLEDENRRLRDQIDKQQLLMNKYRERWEKLKESAKKRRSQPAETVRII
ncbi:hypothetical protein DM01DRAFT_1158766 [Hesseltinella vesiculosa]|uniref:MIT domain-containing protein n=1 Tax=Hesseltinella vesiculosa TaxID=101127 RepID=A0A1X2GSC3_9FUNG|nr:hypothetical protein DM01DRAFT_1158766 [Hesseltinella vesiculosa]